MATVRTLLPYLWPDGDPGAKARVVLAMGLLLLAKLATVYVPVIYGRIVDALAPKDSTALLAIPLGLVIAYGLVRMGAAVFGELRDALFAKVQQRAVRTAARRTFEHLHALSLVIASRCDEVDLAASLFFIGLLHPELENIPSRRMT